MGSGLVLSGSIGLITVVCVNKSSLYREKIFSKLNEEEGIFFVEAASLSISMIVIDFSCPITTLPEEHTHLYRFCAQIIASLNRLYHYFHLQATHA
jgi:hypothetical protein